MLPAAEVPLFVGIDRAHSHNLAKKDSILVLPSVS